MQKAEQLKNLLPSDENILYGLKNLAKILSTIYNDENNYTEEKQKYSLVKLVKMVDEANFLFLEYISLKFNKIYDAKELSITYEMLFKEIIEALHPLCNAADENNIDIYYIGSDNKSLFPVLDEQKLSTNLHLLIKYIENYSNEDYPIFFSNLYKYIYSINNYCLNFLIACKLYLLEKDTVKLNISNEEIYNRIDKIPPFEHINELKKSFNILKTDIDKTHKDFETYANTKALAESFNKRKTAYKIATYIFLTLMIMSLIGIVYEVKSVISSFLETRDKDILFINTPILIVLLWCAWFFSKKHFYYTHLESDYKYKIDLSSTYYKYKEECETFNDKINEEMRKYLYERVLYNITKNPLETLPKGANMPYSEIIQACLKTQDKTKF